MCDSSLHPAALSGTPAYCLENFNWLVLILEENLVSQCGWLPIKTLSASFPLAVSIAVSHLRHKKKCYSVVALNNFPDQGCGSRKPLLASLTLLPFFPISELAINIYEGIWIMWIEMTKHHFENRRVEIAGRWGIAKWHRWKNLPDLKCERCRGSAFEMWCGPRGGGANTQSPCSLCLSLSQCIISLTWIYRCITHLR